ncbi:hypothetical protein HYS31_02225 [Candidatus Woesearchaeota archaeon]|nr:hypothetical protein [Candidatus Woesearchaeota archaeon]
MRISSWIIISAIIIGIAIGTAAAAVDAPYSGFTHDFRISISMQDPDPVEPGKDVEVSFKIENNGTAANGVIFEAIPEYPFSLVAGESASRSIGNIGSSQDGKQSVILRYRFRIAQEAVDGNYEIKIRYKVGGFDSWAMVEHLKIKVQSFDAIIAVEKVIAEPSVVAPGSKAKLGLVIRNYATSLLKNVKVVLDLGESGDESTPFSPIGSTNEKVLSYIEPQSSKTVEFELLTDPDASSKSYKIPISLRYSDSTGRNFSKSNIITLVVGDAPDISVGIESSALYTAKSAGEVTVKIVNKGLPDIKFVNARLETSDKYRIISPAEVYIGNIDSDDYETADFRIFAEKTSEKKLVLPLSIQYKDANNKDYRENVNLELPLYSSSEARKLGLKEGNGRLWWIILIVLIVGGFFGYRYWKKRRKHN